MHIRWASPRALQIDFALTYLQKKTRKYPSNGFAIEVCNLINLANRSWGFAYMPTSSELCIQASRRSTSDSRAHDLPSLLARAISPPGAPGVRRFPPSAGWRSSPRAVVVPSTDVADQLSGRHIKQTWSLLLILCAINFFVMHLSLLLSINGKHSEWIADVQGPGGGVRENWRRPEWRSRRFGEHEARENRKNDGKKKWDLAKCKMVGDHIFWNFANSFGTLQIHINAKLKMHNLEDVPMLNYLRKDYNHHRRMC